MSDLRTIPTDRSGIATAPSLESILDELAQYGRPSLRQFEDGTWAAFVKMHVSAAGATFEIDSDFKHPTHISAALQAADRVREAMRKFAGWQR